MVPALLTWPGPAIFVDPKGEAYAVTAARRAAFGQRVVLFDPFGVTGSSVLDTLNPFQLMDNEETLADDAAVIAKLITKDLQHPADLPHPLSARTAPDQAKTLAEVRRVIEERMVVQMNFAEAMRGRGSCQEDTSPPTSSRSAATRRGLRLSPAHRRI